MSVGIFVDPDFYTIGTGNFLHCFFSNIAYHLENCQWGDRFPYLMENLYNGLLEKQYVENAIEELHTVKKEFSHIPPQKIIWDIDKGTITLGGQDISKIDPEALLKNYAVVFQDVLLFNSSVADNIRIGKPDATDEEIRRVAEFARCDEFVSRMPEGYDTLIGENETKI